MSRIFKNINIPTDLRVEILDNNINYILNGKILGGHHLPSGIKIRMEGNELIIDSSDKMMLGTICALIRNWVNGISTNGYTKELEVLGIGYWVKRSEGILEFKLGYSHLVYYNIPEGIIIEITGTRKIKLISYDKQLLGSVIADLERLRPKSPYRRMGIYVIDKFYLEKKGNKS